MPVGDTEIQCTRTWLRFGERLRFVCLFLSFSAVVTGVTNLGVWKGFFFGVPTQYVELVQQKEALFWR